MCSGIERYYQLAHCFRNEGARPERQPEFSQFEIEMAFATALHVQAVMEQLVHAAGRSVGVEMPATFPRLTYLQAMARYGSDKPHLGIGFHLEGPEATTATRFAAARVALPLPRALTRKEQKQWLAWTQERIGTWGQVRLESQRTAETAHHTVVLAGPLERAQTVLGQLRVALATACGWVEPGVFPVWVEQFPLWEEAPTGGWQSAHHPFTRPLPGHETRWAQPETMLGEAFDLAINGQEIGGGSMRIHEGPLQRQVFAFLGMSVSESEENFRPLLEALALGAPPHGGMALGVERLAATLLELPHIRTVIAFPKTTGGQCLLTQALA
jgi:aspartyl-tRNA synthetase